MKVGGVTAALRNTDYSILLLLVVFSSALQLQVALIHTSDGKRRSASIQLQCSAGELRPVEQSVCFYTTEKIFYERIRLNRVLSPADVTKVKRWIKMEKDRHNTNKPSVRFKVHAVPHDFKTLILRLILKMTKTLNTDLITTWMVKPLTLLASIIHIIHSFIHSSFSSTTLLMCF